MTKRLLTETHDGHTVRGRYDDSSYDGDLNALTINVSCLSVLKSDDLYIAAEIFGKYNINTDESVLYNINVLEVKYKDMQWNYEQGNAMPLHIANIIGDSLQLFSSNSDTLDRIKSLAYETIRTTESVRRLIIQFSDESTAFDVLKLADTESRNQLELQPFANAKEGLA